MGNISMLIASGAVVLLLVMLVFLSFNKRRIVALFVCSCIITVLLIADTNFFRYYYNILTIPVILQCDIRLLSSVDQSIMSLFKIKDVIYLLDLPLMILGLKSLSLKTVEEISLKKRMKIALPIMIIGLVCFFTVYSTTDKGIFAYSGNYVARRMGVLYSHVDLTKNYIKETISNNKGLSGRERQSIESFFKNRKKEGNRLYGAAEGKNLIIIQMEAMQGFVVNRKLNGVEITPNLNRLIKESLYFDNFYFQVAGGNTSDAEFLCNTSLYPVKEGSVYMRYPYNTYHSLPRILKDKGYKTYALHAFDENFWNRKEMYKAIGFDNFFHSENFEKDDFAGWDGTALSDRSFFRQSLDKIDTSSPFYSFFITLSSHHPFTYFENYDFDVGEFEGKYLGNYIRAANYADSCLGEFLQDLKDRGLYENSLLVLYGDHSAVPRHMAGELMEFVGTGYSDAEWIKLQKVPCMIRYPGLEKGEVISVTGGQVDLLPTIANLMGLEADYAMGKDMLNTKKGYAVLRYGHVITDDYLYLNDLKELYDLKSGKALNIKDYKAQINSLLHELQVSDLIVEKNAYSKK